MDDIFNNLFNFWDPFGTKEITVSPTITSATTDLHPGRTTREIFASLPRAAQKQTRIVAWVANNAVLPKIKDVIFNPPATIVKWEDGTKTVVKCQPGDTYSKEVGLAMAICKKAYGNEGKYNDVFNKWLSKS